MKKHNNQSIYKIKIYKEFEFPSFSIDSNNKLSDLYVKSLENINENLNTENYFEVVIENILPFKFQDKTIEKGEINNTNFLIKEFCIADTEEKYGKLNMDLNPNIFTSTGTLIKEVENFYLSRNNFYNKIATEKLILR